jgi:hypothetical protein
MKQAKSTILVFIVLFLLFSCPANNEENEITGPSLDGCPIFPQDNIWNTPVDEMPVDSNSDAYINSIGSTEKLRADFGSGTYLGARIGIPFNKVTGSQPDIEIDYTVYGDESDPGLFPIPLTASIEGGPSGTGDRHVIVVDTQNCMLYELYNALPQADYWNADCGAMFDLKSNALRTDGYTSADAAGLPIFPGLVRYDEVAFGEIKHAIRFTVSQTRNTFVWPARHYASSLTGTEYPPMGQRFRLKNNYIVSGFSTDARVILDALKTYGMMLADNGSDMYLSGVPDERWDNDVLAELQTVEAADFEAVDVSSLMVDPDSGKAKK